MSDTPLTPAQVQAVKELLAERQARWLSQIEGLIAEAVAPLRVEVDDLTSQVAVIQEALGNH